MTNETIVSKIIEAGERIKSVQDNCPVDIILNDMLDRSTIIKHKNWIIAGGYVLTAAHLQNGGDYASSFRNYGLTEDTTDACILHAKLKLENFIDNYEA